MHHEAPEKMSSAELVHAPCCDERPFAKCHPMQQLPANDDLPIFDAFAWLNPHGLWADLMDDVR